jgi:hypothetical protein
VRNQSYIEFERDRLMPRQKPIICNYAVAALGAEVGAGFRIPVQR